MSDGNKKKAERLGIILVRSKAAQVVAVRRVISNVGARSPGWSVPRVQPTTNAQYATLLDQLNKAIKRPLDYVSTPLYRIYITKWKTKTYLCPFLLGQMYASHLWP